MAVVLLSIFLSVGCLLLLSSMNLNHYVGASRQLGYGPRQQDGQPERAHHNYNHGSLPRFA
jgi:hypothetical protein